MECKNCVFWWFNEDVRRDTCNYFGNEADAPCNREDEELHEESYEEYE